MEQQTAEVEDVAFDDAPWIKKGRSGTRYMLGYTIGGRYLFVVYVLKGKGVARVITANDMDDNTRRIYPENGSWPQKAQDSQRRNNILTQKRQSPDW